MIAIVIVVNVIIIITVLVVGLGAATSRKGAKPGKLAFALSLASLSQTQANLELTYWVQRLGAWGRDDVGMIKRGLDRDTRRQPPVN